MTPVDKMLRNLARRIAVGCGVARVVRFRREESGATAVEFALVAVPFIALMFAIFETALAYFAGQMLETAVGDAARLIRTGEAQQQGLTAATFKDKICTELALLLDCANGVRVDVRKFSTFAAMTLAWPLDADGKLKWDDFVFQPGSGSDIVLVRAYYEWPLFLTMLGTNLQNVSNGKHLIGAAVAFRNEPFPW
jgi:Flp pilus assembly protein TadG